MRKRGVLDKTDDLTRELLRQVARQSSTEIAQKRNLSEFAVRRRISNLVSECVIRKFTIEVDDPQLTSAITRVSVSPAAPTSQVRSKVKSVQGSRTRCPRQGSIFPH